MRAILHGLIELEEDDLSSESEEEEQKQKQQEIKDLMQASVNPGQKIVREIMKDLKKSERQP